MLYPVAFRTGGDLASMSTAEFDSVATYVLEYMAADNGVGTLQAGSFVIMDGPNLIGSINDTFYIGNIGEGNVTETSNFINFYFNETPPTGSDAPSFLVYDSAQASIRKSANEEANALADAILTYAVTYDGPNSYQIGTQAPADDGTWEAVATFYDSLDSYTQNTYYLFKKIVGNIYPVTRPLKAISTASGLDLQRFTDTDLQQLAKRVRQRLLTTNIGRYFVGTEVPPDGVWVEKGTYTNIIPTLSAAQYNDTQYASAYAPTIDYIGIGVDAGSYETVLFEKPYTATDTSDYTAGSYSLTFVGVGGFDGGNYIDGSAVNYSATYDGLANYDLTYTGTTILYENNTYIGPNSTNYLGTGSYTLNADYGGYASVPAPYEVENNTNYLGSFQNFIGPATQYAGPVIYTETYTGPDYSGGSGFSTLYLGPAFQGFAGEVTADYLGETFEVLYAAEYTSTYDQKGSKYTGPATQYFGPGLYTHTSGTYSGPETNFNNTDYQLSYDGPNYSTDYAAGVNYLGFLTTLDYTGDTLYQGEGAFEGPGTGETYVGSSIYTGPTFSISYAGPITYIDNVTYAGPGLSIGFNAYYITPSGQYLNTYSQTDSFTVVDPNGELYQAGDPPDVFIAISYDPAYISTATYSGIYDGPPNYLNTLTYLDHQENSGTVYQTISGYGAVYSVNDVYIGNAYMGPGTEVTYLGAASYSGLPEYETNVTVGLYEKSFYPAYADLFRYYIEGGDAGDYAGSAGYIIGTQFGIIEYTGPAVYDSYENLALEYQNTSNFQDPNLVNQTGLQVIGYSGGYSSFIGYSRTFSNSYAAYASPNSYVGYLDSGVYEFTYERIEGAEYSGPGFINLDGQDYLGVGSGFINPDAVTYTSDYTGDYTGPADFAAPPTALYSGLTVPTDYGGTPNLTYTISTSYGDLLYLGGYEGVVLNSELAYTGNYAGLEGYDSIYLVPFPEFGYTTNYQGPPPPSYLNFERDYISDAYTGTALETVNEYKLWRRVA